MHGTDMKVGALLLIMARLSDAGGKWKLKKLGDLVELKSAMHPLNGSVFYRANEPGTIVVSNFHYTQPGPDAFFWVGERRINGGCNDDNIAPDSYSLAPGQTGTNNYYDPRKPILPAYDGSQNDIILKLPTGVTVWNLKWICIWCREFSENFCQINIENGVGKAVGGPEPETRVEVHKDEPITVYGRDGYPRPSRLSKADIYANKLALERYREGWATGDHNIILGVTNKPTFNFYWVTDNDAVYADRFPKFFNNFKKAAERASGRPYSMRFPNIIHREVDGVYYEAADWVVDGYDRGVYWLCARDGRILWDTATTGKVVGAEHHNYL